jgi:hypothetical protein
MGPGFWRWVPERPWAGGGVLARLRLGDDPRCEPARKLAAVSCRHYGAFGYGKNLDDRWAAATA